MAGTIEFIQSVVRTSKKEWEKKFPGIEDILIVHNSVLEKLAPAYFASYIDHDPSAFYTMIRCNPLKGDCSRQMACRWLDEFMYEKCGCPSSYDIKSGMHPTKEHPDFGTMSRKVAISKELLPADNDAEYMDFYQEQMAKMKEMFAAEQKAAKKEEFIAKNGFDPDDPDIIDIPVDDEPAKALPGGGTTSVEQSAGTAVGMPKPIWYGFVVHAAGFGMKLGWDKNVWTLSQGNTTIDKLGFSPTGPQLTEKEEDEMVGEALIGRTAGAIGQHILDAIKLAGCKEGVGLALADVYERFFGPLPANLCESNISWGAQAAIKDLRNAIDRIANGGIVFDGFKEDADALFNKYFGKWNMNESKNPYDDVDEETGAEIREIIDEDDDRSDTEKEISVYEKVEDDVDEEDDELSESVIRHATMLAREIW